MDSITKIAFLTILISINLFCCQASADVKKSKSLSSAIPGISVTRNILDNNSLQVQGSNSTSTNYTCDVTCNVSNAGSPAIFNCTPALPANTSNGDLCDSSGPFDSITGGNYTCK